jgi:hypothetical protein
MGHELHSCNKSYRASSCGYSLLFNKLNPIFFGNFNSLLNIISSYFGWRLLQQALLTSHQAGWDNIHLVYHHLPYAEVPESCHPTHTIALGLGATVRRERWVDDCYHSEMLHRGSVAILPAGVTHRANVRQPLEFMLVGIPLGKKQ